jgi:predicted nuclease of predicted toxin-antitoxin system
VAFLATDHNFDARIVTGLLRRKPDLDVVPIRDVGLASVPDPVVVEWAATAKRVLLTHDRATLQALATDRE